MPARFAPAMVGERRMPSRTSGCATAPLGGEERRAGDDREANEASVRAEVQPASGAPEMPKTSASIAPVPTRRRPGRSGPGPHARRVGGSSRQAAISSTTAIGNGSRKVQRQPAVVRMPPRTSPSEKPLAPVAV